VIFIIFYNTIYSIHWSFQIFQGVWQIRKIDFPDKCLFCFDIFYCKCHQIEENLQELSTSLSTRDGLKRWLLAGGVGYWNFQIYQVVRTIAAWLILAEVANSIHTTEKMKVPQLWVIASLSLNVQEIVNVISYKLMELIMQKKGGLEHTSGVNEILFEFTLSIILETPYWQIGL